jgi:glycosyltransferase involved in cell wall biosynthesis
MACGKALVISRAGGAAELATDGEDALATAPGDTAALAAALDRCAGDRALRARLGAAARQTALRRFDPRTFVGEFLGLYSRLAPAAVTPA